jgi:type IV pilus assembly protein PilO
MNLSDINDLQLDNVGSWPLAAKAAVMALLLSAVLTAGYMLDTRDQREALERVQAEEPRLLAEFLKKQRVIANLEAYRAQLAEMEESLQSMLRQLPTRTEMPDLLEHISNTGLINGLTFDRFKPEAEAPKEFYAVQPLSIRARGSYHQLGAFLSGVSALPRIVTVGNLKIDSAKNAENPDELVLETNLNTYRYLDDDIGDDIGETH